MAEHLERAKALHASTILADGHNDLPWAIGKGFSQAEQADRPNLSVEGIDLTTHEAGLHTDIPRLRKGGMGLQFWSVYSPVPKSTKYYGAPESEYEAVVFTLEQIDRVKRLIAKYPETFELCTSSASAHEIFAAGRIGSAMGAEGGHQMANSMGTLRMLHELGVRYMTLTHNGGPEWADSALNRDGNIGAPRGPLHAGRSTLATPQGGTIVHEPIYGGLTSFGRKVVGEMNRIGMMVDLSHVHAETMRAALRVTQAPCVFSHSGARGVCPHPRNCPDDVLPLVKENGGVIMVTFVSAFVSGPVRANPGGRAVLSEVADHVQYIKEKIGAEHVGIGGDYDGCTELPDGLEDVSCYPALTAELMARGFTDDELKGILGGNVLRVWAATEAVSAKLKADGALPSTARITDPEE